MLDKVRYVTDIVKITTMTLSSTQVQVNFQS